LKTKELVCPVCGSSFQKNLGEYRRQVGNGRLDDQFPCSRSCATKFSNQNKPRKHKDSQYILRASSLEDKSLVSYFLGFCCADGTTLNKGKRTVAWMSTDKHIVEDISSSFYYTRPISLLKPGTGKYKDCWGNIFYANNAQIFIDRGLKQNKADLRWREMKADLYPFLLGIMDGDGSFSLRVLGGRLRVVNLVFLANEKLAYGLYIELEKLGWKCHFRPESGGLGNVRVINEQAPHLLIKMYGSSPLHLKRKRDKFMRAA